jgi:hypothetical protein
MNKIIALTMLVLVMVLSHVAVAEHMDARYLTCELIKQGSADYTVGNTPVVP